MIFEVWQSANGYCRDPERDTVLGSASVDLSVLLFGMPSVSGWFNIMDSTGRCCGQMKVRLNSS
jgi:C2 domain-containing protein 3